MKYIRILRSGAGVWERACVGWKSSPGDSDTMLTICHRWELLVENILRSKYCTKGSMDCLPTLQKLCHCLLWLTRKDDLGIHKRPPHMFAHTVHCTRASGQHGEWGLKSSPCSTYRTSLVAQTVKCLSTMWETWVRSLGLEDLLEKEMAIHSSTIAWKILWTELYLSSDLIWLGGCNYPMEGSHMG